MTCWGQHTDWQGKHIQRCRIFITIIKLTDMPTSHSRTRRCARARAHTHARTRAHAHKPRNASYWEVKWSLWKDVSARIRNPSNVSASYRVTRARVGVWAVGNRTRRRKQEEWACLPSRGFWHMTSEIYIQHKIHKITQKYSKKYLCKVCQLIQENFVHYLLFHIHQYA